MKKFDFQRWHGIISEDNKADDYYSEDEEYVYCDECGNLMVPIDHGYKCPVCGCLEKNP